MKGIYLFLHSLCLLGIVAFVTYLLILLPSRKGFVRNGNSLVFDGRRFVSAWVDLQKLGSGISFCFFRRILRFAKLFS
ncbi:hypothetical protein [Leptospira stimsonii]|uniref:Uncharacterized protein n=1 Tax=Leptospira stimsonii TaxID=2202203 RepID=A0A4R9L1E2_9LEPT|nr:hypothetical protein [Leptospira stimsonii]RHX86300.1 hypothetical protein DLM78_10685 [Leptospira stimsonii]TGK14578.1 hypothetical protein EHO98_17125 [Leptospira stimsonii]TGM10001.1 hypothetical protein EHQ90_20080 [Leptospira stimsonii]